ncbi:hypothetical protein AVEN_45711-1 [Araneus ventricosus]|uniref:Uncharacterized protein n=1 Tax=Araneus ventricosus TaxID=182803 RepID=A0A4Y2NVN1_ARAVE|nr:hypothetical protein AVEN_45711-1 [Araneus ventricosus]
MYISQYLPPGYANSFCLVVKIRDSGPKCLRFKSTCLLKWWLQDEEHATTIFSPTNRWQHHSSHQFHLLPHSTDGSTTTPTASSSPISKVCDRFHSTKSMTHFIAQKPERACAQTMEAAICAYARSTRWCNYRFHDIQNNIKQAGGFSCSCAILFCNVYKSVSTFGQWEFLWFGG